MRGAWDAMNPEGPSPDGPGMHERFTAGSGLSGDRPSGSIFVVDARDSWDAMNPAGPSPDGPGMHEGSQEGSACQETGPPGAAV